MRQGMGSDAGQGCGGQAQAPGVWAEGRRPASVLSGLWGRWGFCGVLAGAAGNPEQGGTLRVRGGQVLDAFGISGATSEGREEPGSRAFI